MRFARIVVTKLIMLRTIPEHRAASVVLVALTILIGSGSCRERPENARRQSHETGRFDSYVLALSWAPAFCASGGSSKTYRECDARRHVGFVVHGLWPQRSDGEMIENCGRVHPVGHEIVEDMLPIMPDRGLIQHEWRAHGSCTGLSPAAYFGLVKKAYYRIKVPSQFSQRGRSMNAAPAQVERLFQTAGGIEESEAVRVACRQGELTEVRVCLSRNLEPIPCSNEVRECRLPAVSIRPIP